MATPLLAGIRVIENASVITGPFTGMILADLGADVIKVEPCEVGDQFRGWDAGKAKVTAGFAAYNRGKRSITLNLQSERGVAIFSDLASDTDVIIENFRPGVADRLGIGYSALRQRNAGLVYCEITGVGSSGPLRDRPTYDAVAQAMSGLWSTFIDMDHPEVVGPPMADQLTAIYGACAVLSALLSRMNTGIGTKICVNMLSSAISFVGSSVTLSVGSRGQNAQEHQTKTSRARLSQSYAFVGRDGGPFAIHLSTPTKFWRALCAAIGLPDMADDDRYNTKEKRIQRYDEIQSTLVPIFATRDRESWLDSLMSADVPCAPILSVREAIEHPQVRHLDMLWQDPASGYSVLRSPIQHEGEFAAASLPVPTLGEHTVEVLSSINLSQEEIEELREAGVV